MKIQKRMRRTTKQYIIVAIICLIVIGGTSIFTSVVITGQIKDEYQELLHNAYENIESNQRMVYIAKADIYPGEVITADKVERKTVYSSQPQDIYITVEGLGKTALINIPTGVPVLNIMITEEDISSELREIEYDVINFNLNIVKNDTVDIRIFYPNGETYVVLSKVIIKEFLPETATCYFWLDEKQIINMSAAIVDAGLYTGSSLYVTKYIEPNIQEASVADYTPSLAILSLLESDPNILERSSQELSKNVRKALENRLADSLAADVTQVNWDVNPNIKLNITPTPVPTSAKGSNKSVDTPEIVPPGQEEGTNKEGPGELGSSNPPDDFFYYAEEEDAKEEDVEYGE